MARRASSHPVSAVIPAGTPMYVQDDTTEHGRFETDTAVTLYRWKPRGAWDHLAMVEGHTIPVYSPILRETTQRRVYVNWRDCRLTHS